MTRQRKRGPLTEQQRRDRMEAAGLTLSAASLGVGILALCLNEKGEHSKQGEKEMAGKIDSGAYDSRRKLKKAYAKEIKKTAVSEIGYTGPIIVLNEKGVPKKYGLVPITEERKRKMSWVAMEMSGKEKQAIVCNSKEEARARAERMKRSNRNGMHGYAYVDTSDIDVARQFRGDAKTYMV